MILIADTHVHLYPSYNLNAALDNAFFNLSQLYSTWKIKQPSLSFQESNPPVFLLCLAERRDCHYFRDLKNNPDLLSSRRYHVVRGEEEQSLTIRRQSGEEIIIIAGRQVVTREKLEILALTMDQDEFEGLPAKQTIDFILGHGGLPVLSWSLGKWLHARGKVVRDLIESGKPNELVIGDTALRPATWPEPPLIRLAKSKGFRVIAGSDPWPLAKEEEQIGSFGIAINAPFDLKKPAFSFRAVVCDPSKEIHLVGERIHSFALLKQQAKWMFHRRSSQQPL